MLYLFDLVIAVCAVFKKQIIAWGRRDDMPPPMAVRLAADLRPSADGSAVRTPLVAGGG